MHSSPFSSERHKRSKSDFEDICAEDALCASDKACIQPKPDDAKAKVKGDINAAAQPGRGAQSFLRKEILQLEKHLKDQQVMRGALEKALGPNVAPVNVSNENPMPKASKELIREIATLELEVKNMEQYLLTLYRKAFEQQVPTFSPPDHRGAPKPPRPASSQPPQLQESPSIKASRKSRADATLRSSYPPPSRKLWNDAATDCSTPACSGRLGDSDALRCQSALSYRGICSSRISPSEDSLARALRSCHSQPFSFLEEGEATASGVISLADRRLKEVEDLLQTYKLILYRLETVDLRRMANEEKIAFWVNIHNALLMHAYLKYGVPQNSLKKTSLLAKAACKIAGRSINVSVIQSMVLGCNTHCPGQWLRTLLHPRIKSKGSKVGHEWQAFAVAQSEPLLRFALCSGSHSDPAVRVYTPKRLFHQLEAAKEEFIRATVGIWKEQKILLPKLVEVYAKDVKLSSQGLVDMVQRYLPETLRMAMQKCQQSRSSKVIEWVPHNLNFRYLLSRDLAFPHLN
ncbi:hypothetical protein GUJ93_ZPchr0013g37211 [Zizania palustris]|uniref:DUF547 domain-containing protein n=1 Tax=Zizania palustris TaxID=103762 RepID=A0A8J5WYM9_ZIZPA|nr:hypothetical protein GUJ93_ZPchr0013g37211 [Zizania palustris]